MEPDPSYSSSATTLSVGGIRTSTRTHVVFCTPKYSQYQYTYLYTEAEFLEEIQTKVVRVFILAIHSHRCRFAVGFLFLQTHATSYSFYSYATEHCKGERRKT